MQNILDKTGLPHDCLELEITESMLMGNLEDSVAIMRRLRKLGISLAMDDFGTGYSSLNYLKKFPVNTLKIDQSFVRELRSDTSDAAVVLAIIGLAKALNLKVVAEGVENTHQLAFLQEHGCNLEDIRLLSCINFRCSPENNKRTCKPDHGQIVLSIHGISRADSPKTL